MIKLYRGEPPIPAACIPCCNRFCLCCCRRDMTAEYTDVSTTIVSANTMATTDSAIVVTVVPVPISEAGGDPHSHSHSQTERDTELEAKVVSGIGTGIGAEIRDLEKGFSTDAVTQNPYNMHSHTPRLPSPPPLSQSLAGSGLQPRTEARSATGSVETGTVLEDPNPMLAFEVTLNFSV